MNSKKGGEAGRNREKMESRGGKLLLGPESSIVLALILVLPPRARKTLIQAGRQTPVAFSFNATRFDRRRLKIEDEDEHDNEHEHD